MSRKGQVITLLIFLGIIGWLFRAELPSFTPIPYYTETATIVQGLLHNLLVRLDSFLTEPSGLWLREHIWMIAGGYGLVALLLLAKRKYRDGGWENMKVLCVVSLGLVAWFLGGAYVSIACGNITRAYGGLHNFQGGAGSWLISTVTGVIWPLLTIALVVTFWIGVPVCLLGLLFVLPSILFVTLRLLVRLPVLTYHYLHYLSVPHPAETAYRAGTANDLPMEELASVVADAMYTYDHGDFDALPPVWKSRNQKKRADAFKDLVNAEGPLMEAIMANLEMKDKLREHRRRTDV